MKSYKIFWAKQQYGTTIIKAETEEKAEEKAETGVHEEVIPLENKLEDWIICNIIEVK